MNAVRLFKYRPLNLITIGVALCSYLLILLLNIMIDPYGIMGSPTLLGINKYKPEKSEKSKLFKAVDITRIQPKTILLGTSTTDFGLNPNHPALFSNQPAYNLAILGANMYELMRYFEHALYNQPEIKQVIIGVDAFTFDKFRPNAVDFDDHRLKVNTLTYQDILNNNFSLDAFVSSVKTILANLIDSKIEPYDALGGRNENWHKENKPFIYMFLRALVRHMHGQITLSQQQFDNFKKIIEMCREQNIDVKVFIPPIHAVITHNDFLNNEIKVEEQEKRMLVKIIPVWDFSDFNSITTENLSERMNNFLDAFHYRKSVGDLVLNRILQFHEETVPADFGFLMTPENVESHLAAIRTQRTQWQNNNPELVKLVQNLEHMKDL